MELDDVVRLDRRWNPTPGTPNPVVWQDEGSAVIAYLAAASTGHEGEGVFLRFDGCLVTQFGYPNDEALPGHPLYSSGVSYYGLFEIGNSSWLAELQQRNLHAFPDAQGWGSGFRHFVVTFHDSSFECISGSLEARYVPTKVVADMNRVGQRPRSAAGQSEQVRATWSPVTPDPDQASD